MTFTTPRNSRIRPWPISKSDVTRASCRIGARIGVWRRQVGLTATGGNPESTRVGDRRRQERLANCLGD